MNMLRFDLRLPEFATVSRTEQYHACLDMCQWADRVGFGGVVVSEHHGTPDGYLPAPVTLASAIAALTTKLTISISALLLPMHDPVRLAEQLVVLDHVARGRIVLILGSGYRQVEFDMLGIKFSDRLQILERNVAVLKQLFTGEEIEFNGRNVRVTPVPHTPGGPTMMLGGSSESAARLAARLRIGFAAADNNPDLDTWYQDECSKIGFDMGFAVVPERLGFIHVSEDPERDWSIIERHALWDAQSYAAWQRPKQNSAVTVRGATTLDDIRNSGVYRVLTVDEAIPMAREGRLMLHPLMGGLHPDFSWESLERIEKKVLPAI
jgi:alkanesulfonate monooxygenase SsuD/methylene tetrahydromethanopterin reductase-like flavin-dependent oxidoreductase (luciferase family)